MKSNIQSITFNGIDPTQSTKKYIKHEIEKWIKREQSPLFLPNSFSYSVHIVRKSYRTYSCELNVQMGSLEWHSFEVGRSVHESVLNAIRSMNVEPNFNAITELSISRSMEAIAS